MAHGSSSDLQADSEAVSPTYRLANRFLGGRTVLRKLIRDESEAHAAISEGVPARAMLRLVDDLHVLTMTSVLMAVGMSPRSFQRRKLAVQRKPSAKLSVEEGSRLWKFTEILAQATQTLGSQDAAEQWLNNPQVGLDGRRPIELLNTAPGAELVGDLLTRMEYGVYT